MNTTLGKRTRDDDGSSSSTTTTTTTTTTTITDSNSATALERRIEKNDLQTRRQLNNLNNSMQRMIMFRGGRQVGVELVAKLSQVKNLDLLWQEYMSGINGFKPASKFTSAERGKVKYRYCRRKVFWRAMTKLLSYGIDASVIIGRLENIYGNDSLSVSVILKNMRKDKELKKYFDNHPLP